MKLETFFEKFEMFADAPDAVAKMRELVLQLAVQGKLVPQDPNDEPAEEFVARIAAALPDKKSENPFLGEIEDSITDESEYELPPGWAWLPLGHVGIWATGCGFPMQYQGETNREYLFCKVSDMNLPGNEVEIHTTVHSIDAEVMKKIRARANPVGTVIFPKIGGAIATHKRRFVIKPTIIDNNCSGIQPIGLTDDRWLLLFMRTLDLTKYQSGTSVPAVSQGSLNPIRLGLPPLAEQKRIVAKVDELMALCDRLALQQQEREETHKALARAALARFADAPTPANLNFIFHPSYAIAPADLRKSILTLAVQGKLVQQDPNDEPAEETFVGLKPLSGELSDGAEIPNQWALCSYRSLTTLVTSGSRGWKEFYAEKGSIFVRTQNIKTDKLVLEDVAFVDLPKSAEGMRTQVLKGDILVTITGANVTKAARVEEKIPEAYVSQHIALTRPRWSKMSEWLHLCFISHGSARGMLEQLAYGDKPGLNLNNIRDLVLPLPPLAEQRRIVAKVDELMKLVDTLETQLAASRATATNLLSALVAELTNKG